MVFRVLRAHEIAGSNPAVLTYLIRCGQTVRRRPVKPTSGGSSPPTGALNGRASKTNWRPCQSVPCDGSCLESSRAPSAPCEFDSGHRRTALVAFRSVPLTERQRFQPSKLARWVQLPQGTLSMQAISPGSSLLVVMPAFEAGVRRFDSYPRN